MHYMVQGPSHMRRQCKPDSFSPSAHKRKREPGNEAKGPRCCPNEILESSKKKMGRENTFNVFTL